MFDPDPKLDALLRKLLHPKLKAIDPSLDRVCRYLEVLGNPQNDLPPVIHVAGTNGKGSTLAIMQAVLMAAGYRVHRYTSPHLVRFNERISLNGNPIETERLEPLLHQILAAQEAYPTTFFEATTVAAFLAFREEPADFVLLETGMGGRLDATNVVDQPTVTVITPVGMDHAQYLGDNIGQIAGEKAGIIKRGRPVVVSPLLPEAAAVLRKHAEAQSAPLFAAQDSWYYQKQGEEQWEYLGKSSYHNLPLPALPGEHQIMNAATALAALEQLEGLVLPHERITEGMRSVQWPARLQPLREGYWREMLSETFTLYLDGGHNPMGARLIAQWLEAQTGGSPSYLIMGMLADKPLEGFLQAFTRPKPQLYALTLETEAPVHNATDIVSVAQKSGLTACEVSSVEEALKQIAKQPPGVVLIAGSLYLAGHILGKN